MAELNAFFSSISHLQKLQNSFPFSVYEKYYKVVCKKMFLPSSVSIIFRLHFSDKVRQKLSTKEISLYKNEILKFVNDSNNYHSIKSHNEIHNLSCLNVDKLKTFLFENETFKILKTENHDEILRTDVLFVKRASSERDRYAGNIAFPGGKFEKADGNDLFTAIRETKEEIGIDLCRDSPLINRYLGHNTCFDITIDFKYFVSSHVFILLDLFKECENHLVLSTNEISDVIFVPIEYFLRISRENEHNFVKMINQKVFGNNVTIQKLMLNLDEKHLLYGLTLRKFMNLINIKDKNVIQYEEKFIFSENPKNYKMIFYSIFRKLFNIFTNPYTTYSFIRNMIVVIIFYYIFSWFKLFIYPRF
jgi:8-oxo-dGTP pyrophosphatase MutT (NUDIX family)